MGKIARFIFILFQILGGRLGERFLPAGLRREQRRLMGGNAQWLLPADTSDALVRDILMRLKETYFELSAVQRALSITVLAVNAVGDWLLEVLEPRSTL